MYMSARASSCIPLLLAALSLPVSGADIVLDYSYDTTGFFNDPQRREALDQAVATFARLADPLAPVQPTGSNSWTISFFNPSGDGSLEVPNPVIRQDEFRVYVGAEPMLSSAARGGTGGYSASGSGSWLDTIRWRGQQQDSRNFVGWGGSMSFNPAKTWAFGLDSPVPSGHLDFYSVAIHELAHVLGFGTSDAWDALIGLSPEGDPYFTGSGSVELYGSAVPLQTGGGHWISGTPSVYGPQAQETAMDPEIFIGSRKHFTDLDFAGLFDIGWQEAMQGDLTGDGVIDEADLAALKAGYTDEGTILWADGDLDNDLDVDFADYVLLAKRFGRQTTYSGFDPPTAPPVPEPSSLALLAFGGAWLARRRRNR